MLNNIKNKKYIGLLFLIIFIIILYLKRVIFPDVSFDTVNYHLFLGINGINNFPLLYKINEFYPMGLHSFSPLIEMAGSFGYSILGYRLGNILSLLSVFGIITLGFLILSDLCKKYLSNNMSLWVCFFVTPLLFVVNEMLFQVGTYFTDNVYSFFLILLLYLLLKFIDDEEHKRQGFYLLSFGLLTGLIITKLTNFIYIIPIFLVIVFYYYDCNKKNNNILIILKRFGLFYLFPIILTNYHLILNFLYTRNPVFPFYNKIFNSVYFPSQSWSFNFGPTNIFERFFYPLYAINDPTMLGEVKDMFPDVKLLIIFLCVLLVYSLNRFKKIKFTKTENTFLFLFLSSFFLWQFFFGYTRYGIFLELFGGILFMVLTLKFIDSGKIKNLIKILVILVLFFVNLVPSIKIIGFNLKYDISWRPTVGAEQWRTLFLSNKLISKYTIVNEEQKGILKKADIVIQCVNPSSLYHLTIRDIKKLPLVNVDKGLNYLLTTDTDYGEKRDELLFDYFKKNELNFITVFVNHGGPYDGTSKEKCLSAISKENSLGDKIIINKEFKINNFLEDNSFGLTVLMGTYKIDSVAE